MKVLKQLKKGVSNNKPIYGFDVETEQFERDGYIEQKFLMGSIVGEDMQMLFWDRKEMMDTMLSLRKLRRAVLMATNLDFDYTHIFQNSKDNAKIKKIYRSGSMIYGRHKDNHTEFLDTWNYTGKMALKKMGDMLGIQKLEQPSCFKRRPDTLSEKREMERYNLRDSLITQRYGSMLREFFTKMGCKMKITIASTGMDYWRRNHQPHDMFQEREEWLRKHYDGSLHGGRVEVITRGYVEDRFYYDYNSHYPARCYYGIDGRGSYPDPNTVKFTDKSSTEIIENYEGISKVDVHCPYMHLPLLGMNSGSGKYIFPTGDLKGWYPHVELRKAMDAGYEINKVHETVYYGSTFKPFRTAIRKLYPMKAKYKKNDPIMSYMVKTMMNAGMFGKFMQKLDGYEEVINIDEIELDDTGRMCYNTKDGYKSIGEHLIRGDTVFMKQAKKHIPLFTFPILSSYTTSLGRLKLWSDFSKYSDILDYFDTDSGTVSKKVFSSSDELGELELEHDIESAIFIRPKFYYLKDRDGKEYFRSKGIGKYIDSKALFNHAVDNRRVMTERFTKIKESGVRNVPYSSIIRVNKNIDLEDDKRAWKGSFRMDRYEHSEPHRIRFGMTNNELRRAEIRANDYLQDQIKSRRSELFASDVFDSHSVGNDIGNEEFLENEIFFETQ